jgi:hypothetical protein
VTNPKNILILESDQTFATHLTRALKATLPARVSVSPNVREACLQLVQKAQDLAFIPASNDTQVIRSLRAIQPDLRLVLMVPTGDYAVPDFYSGLVQGVLIKSLVDVDLTTILRQAGEQPFRSEEPASKPTGAPDTAVLIAALQQSQLGQLLQTVIFAQATHVLAHWGTLNDSEVANVALHVGQEWLQDNYQTRVQFLQLPPRAGECLLYTTAIDRQHLLTLVALPEMPLAQLRRQADQLTGYLLDALNGISTFAAPSNKTSGNRNGAESNQKSYAIVWRPLAPLPQRLHIPLRRALERLALANGCTLRHATVQATLIHLVVECPPHRDSDWAAYLFKNGAEEIIQQEYGVTASLWETGYYATESPDPLSEAELNLFLERPS